MYQILFSQNNKTFLVFTKNLKINVNFFKQITLDQKIKNVRQKSIPWFIRKFSWIFYIWFHTVPNKNHYIVIELKQATEQ